MKDVSGDKKITTRAENYSEWYLDVISAAQLADYSPVKGCMVIRPNGFQLWEKIQSVLDSEFKDIGVRNAYFPMLIPERLLTKEKDHVEGFAPEVAVVTHAGGEKLEEPLVLRPTSETIMYEMYKDWIHSYRDLPLLINQWANVIRWEKKTKPFLRTTEFLWQEGHTVHLNNDESDKFARKMLNVYSDFAKNYMALPVIMGQKTESEKFAGALHTYTCEAMMQDGKALQFSTSHNLGDNFAKAFGITYLDENNISQFGFQTSWGLSTRSIGGLIMTHSDDKGLVLPPKMATIKIAIVPIVNTENKESVMQVVADIFNTLISSTNFSKNSIFIDDRDMRPGDKYFYHEKQGTPIRLEIGPKDIEKNQCVLVRRDTGEKIFTPISDLTVAVVELLDTMQNDLYNKAKNNLDNKIKQVSSWDEFTKEIEQNNFVMAYYDGTAETEKIIKEETKATVRCIPFDEKPSKGVCIKTGKESSQKVLFAKAY